MPIQLVVRPAPGCQEDFNSILSNKADQCLGSELFSDLLIESPDGMILCHQSVLSPLSPLLSSLLGSYPSFPGLVHTVVMPTKTETVKIILKIIYNGRATLSSQAQVDQVLSGLKLLGIHLPGLECFKAARQCSTDVRAGQQLMSRTAATNVTPISFVNHSQSTSTLQTSIVQLPNVPVMEDVKPLVSSFSQPNSLDNLRIVLIRQLLPLSIGESAECNVEGCSVMVTLSTLAKHFEDHKNESCKVFKCNICGEGFKHKKTLEIHKLKEHDQYVESKSDQTEEASPCVNNNIVTSNSIISFTTPNRKRKRSVYESMAASQVAAINPEPSLVCALCQASLSSEWYRPPSRHNCSHSTPRPSKSRIQCSKCSTPLSSNWYLPPSRHGCKAASTTTPGQAVSSSIARKKPRLSAIGIASCENIEEIKHNCGKCSSKFNSLVELRSHYTVSHYWDTIESKFAKWGTRCYICLRAYHSCDQLVRHMGNFHCFVDQCLLKDSLDYSIDEKSIKLRTRECGLCGEVKNTSSDLKKHLVIHFSKELEREFPSINSAVGRKTCDRCGKLFNSNETRTRHIGSSHDEVLKYAKKFINVAVNDAKLIPENGFTEGTIEASEPFEEEQLSQFLADWQSVSRIASPKVTEKNVSIDASIAENSLGISSQALVPSEELQTEHKCPLTTCFTQSRTKADLLVHLAMIHYKDELENEYCTDFEESCCKICKKRLSNKESFLMHMSVTHEVVMAYVERDMTSFETQLNNAVPDLKVSN